MYTHLTLKKENDYFIEFSSEAKASKPLSPATDGSWDKYKSDYVNWKKSIQKAVVSEETMNGFKNWYLNTPEDKPLYLNALEQGIDLLPIQDRIEIERNCCGRCTDTDECDDREFKYTATLKPKVEYKSVCNDSLMAKYISEYINDLPEKWTTKFDMSLAMKNAMVEAVSYPEKYITESDIAKPKVEESEPDENGWISVEDRLPEDGQRVLYFTNYGKDGEMHMGSFLKTDQWSRKDYFCDGAYHHISKTTHWTPLPKPPIKSLNK